MCVHRDVHVVREIVLYACVCVCALNTVPKDEFLEMTAVQSLMASTCFPASMDAGLEPKPWKIALSQLAVCT